MPTAYWYLDWKRSTDRKSIGKKEPAKFCHIQTLMEEGYSLLLLRRCPSLYNVWKGNSTYLVVQVLTYRVVALIVSLQLYGG